VLADSMTNLFVIDKQFSL